MGGVGRLRCWFEPDLQNEGRCLSPWAEAKASSAFVYIPPSQLAGPSASVPLPPLLLVVVAVVTARTASILLLSPTALVRIAIPPPHRLNQAQSLNCQFFLFSFIIPPTLLPGMERWRSSETTKSGTIASLFACQSLGCDCKCRCVSSE